MCEHVRATVEARVRIEMARSRLNPYQEGYLDALLWALDLIDFSNLETGNGG